VEREARFLLTVALIGSATSTVSIESMSEISYYSHCTVKKSWIQSFESNLHETIDWIQKDFVEASVIVEDMIEIFCSNSTTLHLPTFWAAALRSCGRLWRNSNGDFGTKSFDWNRPMLEQIKENAGMNNPHNNFSTGIQLKARPSQLITSYFADNSTELLNFSLGSQMLFRLV